MIDKQEVMNFAREFGLSQQVIEKDFTLGWLLAGISAHPEIGQSGPLKVVRVLKNVILKPIDFQKTWILH